MCSERRTMVELIDVGKRYDIYQKPSDRFKQLIAPLIGSKRLYRREFWALRALSLAINKGEVLGVIGVNGAGKSTLLQLITGVMVPSLGAIKVHGRVAALLELGAGFNPEFTGRENIFLNASLLGLTKAEICDRFDEIVTFAGLGAAIDQPVKTYSSGMYVRLGFSIATSVDPDLLIIDEALSVGDGAFARKSFDRILGMKNRGTTVIFCSHSLFQVEAFCNRVLWLHEGRAMMLDEPAEVVCAYQEHLDLQIAVSQGPFRAADDDSLIDSFNELEERAREPASPAHLSEQTATRIDLILTWVNQNLPKRNLTLRSGVDRLSVRVRLKSDPRSATPSIGFTLHANDGRTITSGANWLHDLEIIRNAEGVAELEFSIPNFPLLKGHYHLSVHLLCERGIHVLESASSVCLIEVLQDSLEQGIFRAHQLWQNTKWLRPQHQNNHTPDSNVTAKRFRWATAKDANEIAQLLVSRSTQGDKAFSFRSKYTAGETLGLVADDGDQLIGFCGGIARNVLYFGVQHKAVQICDAVIQTKQSQSLNRHRLIHNLASQFLGQSVGFGRSYLLGFGFADPRTNRLAGHLGLCEPISTITEWRWLANTGMRSLTLSGEVINRENLAASEALIDRLWSEMASSLNGTIVCERNSGWYKYRYFSAAKPIYFGYLIGSRVFGRRIGLIIFRRHKQELEIVDMLCKPEYLSVLIDWATRYAARAECHTIFLWASEILEQFLNSGSLSKKSLNLSVISNAFSPGPSPSSIRGKWWLMGGDSDLR